MKPFQKITAKKSCHVENLLMIVNYYYITLLRPPSYQKDTPSGKQRIWRHLRTECIKKRRTSTYLRKLSTERLEPNMHQWEEIFFLPPISALTKKLIRILWTNY